MRNSNCTGLAAPKDPVEKRNGFFILYETIIEASARQDGKFTQDIYLEGRLSEKAKFSGGVEDEEIMELLTTCKGSASWCTAWG